MLLRFLATTLVVFPLFSLSIQAAEDKTIVVYGASGKIGGLIVDVALERGHKVIGVSRNPDRLSRDNENFSAVKGDVTNPDSIRSTARNADAIIISVTGAGKDNKPENSLEARAAKAMIDTYTGQEESPRVIQIGGATTMYGTAEAMEKNLPFPAEKGTPMHGMLFGHLVALQIYQASAITWTVVTPAQDILGWSPQGLTDPDTSRGSYRTSTTKILKDADGNSIIYVRDLANAAIDEIENGKFIRQRFTVAY